MWFVISDTHIGDRQANKFLPKLFDLLEDFSNPDITLVLNGDIFDLAKSLSFDERHRTFLNLIKGFKETIYIVGNHDWCMCGLKDALPNITFKPEHRLRLNHHIIRLTHGHQSDRCVINFPRFNRFLIRLNSWIYDQINFDIQHKFRHTWLVQKFLLEKQENRLMRAEKTANIIIAGHTHRPCVRERYGVKYYNTGDWVEDGHAAYVTIQETGEIKLVRV